MTPSPYLVSNFAAYFGAFKDAEALQYMTMSPRGRGRLGDTRSAYMSGSRAGARCHTVLEDLGEPFMVSLPKEKSATGKHELHSLSWTPAA